MPILKEKKSWARAKSERVTRVGTLTPTEIENVRAAVRVLGVRFGSYVALAKAMGIHRNNVIRWASPNGRTPTASVALEVARLAGVPVDDVLIGTFPAPGSCPLCGRSEPASGELSDIQHGPGR